LHGEEDQIVETLKADFAVMGEEVNGKRYG